MACKFVDGLPSCLLTVAWYQVLHSRRSFRNCDLYHSLTSYCHQEGLVVTVHDLSFMRMPACADPGLQAFLTASVPRTVKEAHHILADSSNTRNDLIELLQVNPRKVSVVPGAVDSAFARVEDTDRLSEMRIRYRLPEWFIVSVGTLEPRKNYPRLISAFAEMRRQTGLPHHLVIAGGPGWLYGEIQERVRYEGIGEFVRFLGFVPDGDLAALYTLADLMVFPSLYEGFGLPPLEAMACGTPVVCSDNSSLPERRTPLRVNADEVEEIADAMGRVLANRDLRNRLVELGMTQAAQFTWHAAARKLLEAYKRTLAEGGIHP
jgi:glycosyltransferase involved in cell wall biosynthesis